MNIENLHWQKSNGLLPAIVQHAQTGQVLMLGYMNQTALQQTLDTKQVTFFSRQRQCLWIKGETSGNYLQLVSICDDCDHDTLLIHAIPAGPTCHLGTTTCFTDESTPWQTLSDLEAVITQRQQNNNADSYSAELLQRGINKVAQKVGEEASEVIIAALAESDDRLCNETADLLYHLLLLLRARRVSIEQVYSVLQERRSNKTDK